MIDAVRRCIGSTPKLMYAAITEPGMCTLNVHIDTAIIMKFPTVIINTYMVLPYSLLHQGINLYDYYKENMKFVYLKLETLTSY